MGHCALGSRSGSSPWCEVNKDLQLKTKTVTKTVTSGLEKATMSTGKEWMLSSTDQLLSPVCTNTTSVRSVMLPLLLPPQGGFGANTGMGPVSKGRLRCG